LTAAGGVAVRDREFASIRIYRDGTLYQIPLETYLANPELGKKVLQNGDAVYVDTSYDLDRAMEFYKLKIDVITLRSNARNTALQALSTEIGLQRSALQEQRSNFQARVELGAVDRDYVYISGEVRTQNRFPLPFNQQASLADVLYDGGGFNNTTGDPSEIYVLRGNKDGTVTAYHLNAANAANLVLATSLQMRPNDVVFIEEQPITKWNRSLQQLFPALLNGVNSSL
jgi:polysaccharide export outer membrane protein